MGALSHDMHAQSKNALCTVQIVCISPCTLHTAKHVACVPLHGVDDKMTRQTDGMSRKDRREG